MARRRRQPPKNKGYHWDMVRPVVLPCGGRPCRWCKRPVPRGRQSWCGGERCVHEWRLRTDPAYFRYVIFARDRGVCAACKADCRDYDLKRIDGQIALHAALEVAPSGRRRAILEGLERSASPAGPGVWGAPEIVPLDRWIVMRKAAVAWRRVNRVPKGRSPWEADHVRPIGLGGDWFDISGNVQTLCCPCHRVKTNDDSRRIREAKGRRPG